MLECNVFGLKETKKNGSLSCEVVDLRKIRAISGVSRAKITRKSIVHSRKICELTTCPYEAGNSMQFEGIEMQCARRSKQRQLFGCSSNRVI